MRTPRPRLQPFTSLFLFCLGLSGLLVLTGCQAALNQAEPTAAVTELSRAAETSATIPASPSATARPETRSAESESDVSARGLAAPLPVSPAATMLRALRDQLAAGQWAAAEALVPQLEADAGGHPARLIGEAAQQAGRLNQAEQWYRQALVSGLSRSHEVNVYERLGQVAEARSDWGSAAEAYQAAGDRARTPNYRAEAAYRRAMNLQRAGDPAAAQTVLVATARSYPATPYGARALESLRTAGARDLVEPRLRGIAYETQGDLAAAAEAYGKAAEQAASPDAAIEARYLRALVNQRQDDPTAAAEFAAIVNDAPGHPRAADALWSSAVNLRTAGELSAARARLEDLAAQHPTSSWADDALVEAGILAWRAGDQTGGRLNWDIAIARYRDRDTASQAFYWRGKADAQAAKSDAAGRADLEAAAAYDDYYGYRARAALQGEWRPPAQPAGDAASWTVPLRTPADEAAALDWLATWSPVEGWTLDATDGLIATPGFRRGLVLHDAGLATDARGELSDLADELTREPENLLRLAIWLAEHGQSGAAMTAAQRLVALAAEAGQTSSPKVLDRLIYPNAFADLVVRHSAERDLDPAWVLSLLRQESAFNPTVRSPVGARGLAQIMPTTGELIAKALGKPFDPADLDRPAVAVDYGTYYLAGELRKFRGDMMLTLAAYNAGGGAVSRWLRGATTYPDYDLFVESIPYRETRAYVKKIYVNYYRYRAIYGSPS